MAFKTLDDMDLQGRTVLIRLDLNLPVDDGVIADPTRLERALPTIRDVIAKGGLPVLLSHFGRPKGNADPAQSLGFALQPLIDALGAPGVFGEDCVGDAAAQAIAKAPTGGFALLENTRFHAGEEANDPAFVDALAALGDVYVNDAFSAAHRAHASTEGLARRLPAAAGRNMQAELRALDAALGAPKRPAIAIVGGAKVSTKLKVLGHLAAKVDQIVIGGGMANTFLLARGAPVGKSLAEPDLVDAARAVEAQAQAAGCTIVLPIDVIVAREFKAHADHAAIPADGCPDDALILDAGPATVADLEKRFAAAKTIVWNGPLGAFETPPFDAATMAAARAAAALCASGALTAVAGGGDTVAALNAAGVADQFTYISTAGGAFLEWMEGATLPGVAALEAAA